VKGLAGEDSEIVFNSFVCANCEIGDVELRLRTTPSPMSRDGITKSVKLLLLLKVCCCCSIMTSGEGVRGRKFIGGVGVRWKGGQGGLHALDPDEDNEENEEVGEYVQDDETECFGEEKEDFFCEIRDNDVFGEGVDDIRVNDVFGEGVGEIDEAEENEDEGDLVSYSSRCFPILCFLH
jgi:hypothetical protein